MYILYFQCVYRKCFFSPIFWSTALRTPNGNEHRCIKCMNSLETGHEPYFDEVVIRIDRIRDNRGKPSCKHRCLRIVLSTPVVWPSLRKCNTTLLCPETSEARRYRRIFKRFFFLVEHAG